MILKTCLLLLTAGFCLAQRHQLKAINAETPHGAILQQIAQEGDAAKKLALIDDFLAKFGADDARKEEVLWVLPQKQDLHVKANDFDKVIQTGDRVLAMDPDYLEVAVATLKAAEGKKDTALVKTWAAKTSAIAKKSIGNPKPQGEEDEAAAKERVDYAKQVDTYCEYALFSQAIQPGNPALTVEMAEALKQLNPQSQYWKQVAPTYILSLNSLKQTDKAVAAAEEHVQTDASNDDVLLLVADFYFNKKPQPAKADFEKVMLYSTKTVQSWNNKPKPQGVSDADWEKKRGLSLGYAHWMNGIALASQNKLTESDTALRAALPFLTNDQMKAAALFNLGLANYRLGEASKPPNKARLTDAARFNLLCSTIKSPYQAQAAKNLSVITRTYGLTGK